MDKSPMLLSLRWDNSELCHPGQQPPETGGLLSIQNVASVTRGQEFQILFDFHSFKAEGHYELMWEFRARLEMP